MFGNNSGESVAFIRVNEESVGGAYAHFTKGSPPQIAYVKRVDIEKRSGEAAEAGVARALATLGEFLIKEGAPALARLAHSGKVAYVLVAIDAPWQETAIRQEKIERTAPFTFTKSILNAALSKSAQVPDGAVLADESIVGTVLDGYETKSPIGKHVSRVNVIILNSYLDGKIAETVATAMRSTFHLSENRIRFVAASSVRYQAVRTLFPHEEDFLLIDTSSHSIVTALVRRKLLVAVEHQPLPNPAANVADWAPGIKKTLEQITTRFPLPRTIFFIAADADRNALKELFMSPTFAEIRLSTEPPQVIGVDESHTLDQIKLTGEAIADLGLISLVLFWSVSRS